MDIKELRYFMYVARAGSVSRAAEELRLAQPALSRQIRKLEQSLGVTLFARHGRGVRLSAAGSLLLERAETITRLVQETSEEIKDRRAPPGGRITVGAPPAAGRLLIPPSPSASRKHGRRPLCTCAKAFPVRCRNGCWKSASTSPFCTTPRTSKRSIYVRF
ncbi:MAG TPA: LysR family transcriptional regulator [Pseudolabrys sp.]|nr:LysR family transcriptional regulator [Pseudolabrys sp.]